MQNGARRQGKEVGAFHFLILDFYFVFGAYYLVLR